MIVLDQIKKPLKEDIVPVLLTDETMNNRKNIILKKIADMQRDY